VEEADNVSVNKETSEIARHIDRQQLDSDSRDADQALLRLKSAIDVSTLNFWQRMLNNVGLWLIRSSLPR